MNRRTRRGKGRTATGVAMTRLRVALCLLLWTVMVPVLLGGGISSARVDWGWLSGRDVRRDWVTDGLNTIWRLSSREERTGEAKALRAAQRKASKEGKRAAGLLIGAALERAADRQGATAAYRSIVQEEKGTPYAASAAARLRLLEGPKGGKEREALWEKVAAESETEGWYIESGQWAWTTSRRAALQALVDSRSGRLSFRLFAFLRSMSTFPTPYGYLFVLLVLGVGVKVLALPLHARTAKLTVQLRRLQPEIQMIQRSYAGDPAAMQQRLLQLWSRHGLNPWGGCAVALVDLIFVIWGLVTLSDFSPQLALDTARFWWVSDVTKPNLGIVMLWLGVSFLQGLYSAAVQPGQGGKVVVQLLVSGVIFMGIAWYWAWPAYVLIFWGLLALLGILISLILVPILAAFE